MEWSNGSYYFAGGQEYTNVLSFGNYALAYEAGLSESLVEKEYISEEHYEIHS